MGVLFMPFRSAAICASVAWACLVQPQHANADPWLDPGDLSLRHDLVLLADAGILGSPITQWPMSWGDINPDESRLDRPLRAGEIAALRRVRQRLREARQIDTWQPGWSVRAGTDGWIVRGFEDTPRENLEAGGSLTWTGERFAVRLRGQYAFDAEDDREWRADGSYAGIALGNWMLAAAITDRWWGPGWQSSGILTNNARPFPAITIDRNSTEPFESRWLRWLGHWDLVTMFGFLESERAVPEAQFWGMRVTVKPARWLEVGLSRIAFWCGEDRPCSLDTFGDVLLGNDNAGDNVSAEDEPGNQLAGYDIRLTGAGIGLPFAVYVQQIGEDEQNLKPALFITQFGVEHWGSFASGATYRIYVEAADTLCGGNLFGGGSADVCYNHPIYSSGVRYRGRPIANSADNDAKLVTAGLVFNQVDDSRWTMTATGGKLNREGLFGNANSVSPERADYLGVSLGHRRALGLGELQAVAGYESIDPVSGSRSDDWRFSVQWQAGW